MNLVDPDGRKIVIGMIWEQNMAKYGAKTDYIEKVEKDITQLKKDNPDVDKMITSLENSQNTHMIISPKKGKYNSSTASKEKFDKGIPQGSTVTYDPYNKWNRSGEKRTPRVALSHELKHSSDFDKGINIDLKTFNGIPISEVEAVNTENKIREKTNDPERTTYGNEKIPDIWLE